VERFIHLLQALSFVALSGEQELTKVKTVSFVALCSFNVLKIIKFCRFIHLLQAKV